MQYSLRELLKHTSIYSFGRLASKAVGFLLIPLYTHYLTPHDYGIQELLMVAITLIGIIAQGGISAALFKFYNLYTQDSDRRSVVATILYFVISSCLFCCIIMWIAADQVSFLFIGENSYGHYVQLMLVSFFFSSVATVPESLIRAHKRSKLFTLISLGTLVVNLSLNIYMVAVAKMGLEGILYASIIARILNTGFLLAITRDAMGAGFKFSMLKQILSFSTPLIPAHLGLFIYAFSDRLFLTHMSSLESVGLYALGYKFPFMISLLLIQPFMAIWQQEMYEIKERPDAPHVFGKIFTYYYAVILISGALMTVFIREIIVVMASDRFVNAWKVVPIICLAYVFRGSYLYFQMGMLFSNKTQYLGYATMFGAALILGLNYLLIPGLNEVGAALAQLGSYFFLAVAGFLLSQRFYKVEVEYSKIIKSFSIFVLIVAFFVSVPIESFVLSVLIRACSIPLMLYTLYRLRLFSDVDVLNVPGLKNLRSRLLRFGSA